MHKNCKQIKDIVSMWHETEVGHYKKCREKQREFSDIMWKLYEEIKNEQEDIKAN